MNAPIPLSRQAVGRLLLIGVVVGVISTGALAASGGAASDPSPLPAAYYGNVTVGDDPLPDDYIIEAEIDGEVRGTITTTDGKYGSSDPTGPKLTVNGTATEDGNRNATFYVANDAGERVRAEESVIWESGAVERVDLSVEGDLPGQGSNNDGGGGGGGGGAIMPPSPDPEFFEVNTLDPVDVTVEQGDTIDVSATITNTGGQSSQQTVEFRVDDSVVAEQSVVVRSGGGETTVTFENIDTSDFEAGDYTHGIHTGNDSQTGTLTIEAVDDGDGGEDGTADDDGGTDADDSGTAETTPGFGVVVALVAIIAAALLSLRWRP